MTLFFVPELISCGTGIPLKIKPNSSRKPAKQIGKAKLYLQGNLPSLFLLDSGLQRCRTCTTRKKGLGVSFWFFAGSITLYIFHQGFVLLLQTGVRTLHHQTAGLLLLPSFVQNRENPACLCYPGKEIICGNQLAWWRVSISCPVDISPASQASGLLADTVWCGLCLCFSVITWP